jgi:hypothetical protein
VSTAERDAEIARLYRAGQTMAAVGARFGISDERVRQILARHGVPRRPSGESLRVKGALTPERRADIVRRHERGEPVAAIAAALRLSPKRVSGVLHAAGRETVNRRYRNRAGQPRTCTRCLRTERDGAAFSPGEAANRCKECVAATTRAWYRKNAERKRAYERRRRGRTGSPPDAPGHHERSVPDA